MKKLLRTGLRRAKRWLQEDASTSPPEQLPSIPFDNSYEWLGVSFERLMRDPLCSRRPQYVWGILQGTALAKVLGLERVCLLEFGVAAGAGLIVMEQIAAWCEQTIGLKPEVIGFDTGTGMPKPADFRDLPYKFFEGYYGCDQAELARRLTRSRVSYGLIAETAARFLKESHDPIAFVSYDLAMYTAARDALQVFNAEASRLLPRTACTFRAAVGRDVCPYTGELLAISEFNASQDKRKICEIPGAHYFVPARYRGHWIGMLRTLHILDHPLYNMPHALKLSASIDIEGREAFVPASLGASVTAAECSASSSKVSSQ